MPGPAPMPGCHPATWLGDELLALLADHGAALCIHDLLPGHPWERTTDWTYVRFHAPDAVTAPYRGAYTGRRLWRPAERLGGWLDEGVDVYAAFNNDIGAAAFTDATWLARHLAPG